MANFTGTAGDDNINGTASDDVFRLKQGGSDTAFGDAGNDTFIMLDAFDASESLDGGADFDHVILDGVYALAILFGADTISNIEQLTLIGPGFDLTLDRHNVAAGETLIVDATGSTGSNLIDASQLRTGMIDYRGGSVGDEVDGGLGADQFDFKLGGSDFVHAGSGKDTIKMGGAFDLSD